jgi:hypothetical protein
MKTSIPGLCAPLMFSKTRVAQKSFCGLTLENISGAQSMFLVKLVSKKSSTERLYQKHRLRATDVF